MLRHQWTRSPLSLSHTQTNMCLQICFVAVSALTYLIDHFMSHSASLEWTSVGFVFMVFSVCACSLLSQWAVFQSGKGILQKISPYGTNKVSNQLRIPGVFNTVKARWEGGIMSSPHNFFRIAHSNGSDLVLRFACSINRLFCHYADMWKFYLK